LLAFRLLLLRDQAQLPSGPRSFAAGRCREVNPCRGSICSAGFAGVAASDRFELALKGADRECELAAVKGVLVDLLGPEHPVADPLAVLAELLLGGGHGRADHAVGANASGSGAHHAGQPAVLKDHASAARFLFGPDPVAADGPAAICAQRVRPGLVLATHGL
jgi:hypothetical protein